VVVARTEIWRDSTVRILATLGIILSLGLE